MHEKDGGSCSGSSSETVSCFERECPGTYITNSSQTVSQILDLCRLDSFAISNLIFHLVHCEWNDFVIGECDKECGGGMRTNTRTEKQGAQHGGEECPGPASIEESCNVQECPGIII